MDYSDKGYIWPGFDTDKLKIKPNEELLWPIVMKDGIECYDTGGGMLITKAFVEKLNTEYEATFKPKFIGVDAGSQDTTVVIKTYMENDKLIVQEIAASEMFISQKEISTFHYLSDEKPRDLYYLGMIGPTKLYFECPCGAQHDPDTISFQTLLDSAKMAGWSILFKDIGYEVKCKECNT